MESGPGIFEGQEGSQPRTSEPQRGGDVVPDCDYSIITYFDFHGHAWTIYTYVLHELEL